MSNFPNRGFYRGDLNAALKDYGVLLVPPEEVPIPRGEGGDAIDSVTGEDVDIGVNTPTEVQSPLSPREMGYTGNTCSNCGSSRMNIAGHCEVCADCGTTTGCS